MKQARNEMIAIALLLTTLCCCNANAQDCPQPCPSDDVNGISTDMPAHRIRLGTLREQRNSLNFRLRRTADKAQRAAIQEKLTTVNGEIKALQAGNASSIKQRASGSQQIQPLLQR